MKYLILLIIIFINHLNAEQNSSKYFSYNDFLKIKSSFNENGCEGIEYFFQSSKDLNLSNKLYIRDDNGREMLHEIKNLPYQNLCLISGSTQFEADGEIKDTTVKFMKNKNYWENNFPKNEKIISLVFKTPIDKRKMCTVPEYQSSAYYIIYQKENGKIIRKIYFNINAEENCIKSQLVNILNTKSIKGTINATSQNNKKYCIVHETMDKGSKESDRIPFDQKILIIGTINGSTFIYYNKKSKDMCEPLKEDCDSGWIDTSVIEVKPK